MISVPDDAFLAMLTDAPTEDDDTLYIARGAQHRQWHVYGVVKIVRFTKQYNRIVIMPLGDDLWSYYQLASYV